MAAAGRFRGMGGGRRGGGGGGSDPTELLERALASGRVHSAYLLAGAGAEPRDAALRFVRGLVCEGAAPGPCEACPACRRSGAGADDPIALDGAGRRGPLYRHVGDHADLFWVERGAEDTRVRIGQIRALQAALRLRGSQGGRRAAVVADAEWLNQEAQNALLRVLEEPPPRTTLVLVSASAAGLLATVRSRCQRIPFRRVRPARLLADADAGTRELVTRLEGIGAASLADLLDWAESYRGARAEAAAGVTRLLETASAWLRDRVVDALDRGHEEVAGELAAFARLQACRQSLAQRNANPQLTAEQALLVVHQALRA
jgi:hypothetical protein